MGNDQGRDNLYVSAFNVETLLLRVDVLESYIVPYIVFDTPLTPYLSCSHTNDL
jgi:hypothetical protein